MKFTFDDYTVKTKTIESASNYDLSVNIFKGNKLIGGTIMKRHTKEMDVLSYAIESIKEKPVCFL